MALCKRLPKIFHILTKFFEDETVERKKVALLCFLKKNILGLKSNMSTFTLQRNYYYLRFTYY